MKTGILRAAVMLGKKIGHVLVATADMEGLPHVAAAGQMDVKSENKVEVSEWFCPGTVANVKANPRVALLVWDAKTDHGYQLLGTVEKIEEGAMMNGYAAELEEMKPISQVERRLIVQVDKIINFSHGPHSDVEE